MHAVVVDVTINDFDTAQKVLHEQVVPRVSQAPGFVAGYWLRPEADKGHSIVVFESEDAARTASERVQAEPPPPEAVTIDNVQVREVLANA